MLLCLIRVQVSIRKWITGPEPRCWPTSGSCVSAKWQSYNQTKSPNTPGADGTFYFRHGIFCDLLLRRELPRVLGQQDLSGLRNTQAKRVKTTSSTSGAPSGRSPLSTFSAGLTDRSSRLWEARSGRLKSYLGRRGFVAQIFFLSGVGLREPEIREHGCGVLADQAESAPKLISPAKRPINRNDRDSTSEKPKNVL